MGCDADRVRVVGVGGVDGVGRVVGVSVFPSWGEGVAGVANRCSSNRCSGVGSMTTPFRSVTRVTLDKLPKVCYDGFVGLVARHERKERG